MLLINIFNTVLKVRLYSGRKLECESSHCAKRRSELDFITAVEFSSENPYGTAVALLELKSGIITVKEEWFLVPGITVGFIVIEMVKKEGFSSLSVGGNSMEGVSDVSQAADGLCLQNKKADDSCELNLDLTGVETVMLDKEIVNSGRCGAGCGGGCGNKVNSGGCSGCGGGCGSGCGGCGGGFGGNKAATFCGGSGGCGGCGGGLGGNKVTADGNTTFCGGSGGCGGCGGRSFGNTEKSAGSCKGCGGCTGGCGGACGVNPTHQTSTTSTCNREISQQVAINAH